LSAVSIINSVSTCSPHASSCRSHLERDHSTRAEAPEPVRSFGLHGAYRSQALAGHDLDAPGQLSRRRVRAA
jgi:hypothetical protein